MGEWTGRIAGTDDSAKSAHLLIDHIGNDLTRIKSEIEKSGSTWAAGKRLLRMISKIS
jgi:hypothetical protein